MSALREFFTGPSEARSAASWGRDILSVEPNTAAGQIVTTETALQVSAVYACVRILADTLSTLPIGTYVRRGTARYSRPTPEWLRTPNARMGTIDLISQIMVSLLLAGNAYLWVVRQGGTIVSLYVLDPAKVTPEEVNGRLLFRVGSDLYGPDQVLHIPGLMLPGALVGLSPIACAAQTIGLSLAAQEYGAAFFGNSGIPSAVIETPGPLSDTGKRQARAAWNDLHRGSSNAARVGVLTEGAKLTKITLAPEEAQFLQTRAFQVPDIARIFGVPPHLLADASGSTSWGSGLAEQNVAFSQFSLRTWAARLEAALTRLHLSTSEGQADGNRDAFLRVELDGLERGSLANRMEAYTAGLMNGIYNLDEVRGYEDLPPLPNGAGQVHRFPLAMGEVGAESSPSPPPTPAQEPPA